MAGSPDSRDVKLTMAFLREDAPRTTVVEPTFHRQYDGVVEIGGAGPGSPNARNWNRFFEQHEVTVRNGRTALGPLSSPLVIARGRTPSAALAGPCYTCVAGFVCGATDGSVCIVVLLNVFPLLMFLRVFLWGFFFTPDRHSCVGCVQMNPPSTK